MSPTKNDPINQIKADAGEGERTDNLYELELTEDFGGYGIGIDHVIDPIYHDEDDENDGSHSAGEFPLSTVQQANAVKEKKRTLTVQGAVLSLCVGMVGTGILSLPWAFSYAGIINGLILILVVAILNDMTLCMLVRMMNETQQFSFMSSTRYFFGRVPSILMALLVVSDFFLGCVTQATMISESLAAQYSMANGHAREGLLRKWAYCKQDGCTFITEPIICILVLLALSPFFLKRSVGSLRHFVNCSVFCSFVALTLFFILYFDHINNPDRTDRKTGIRCNPDVTVNNFCMRYGDNNAKCLMEDPSLPNAMENPTYCVCSEGFFGDSCAKPYVAFHEDVNLVFTSFLKICGAIGTIVSSYMCHTQLFPVYLTMKEPEKIYRVIHISILGICTPLYMIFGLFGYFLFGDEVTSNVFINFHTFGGHIALCFVIVAAMLKLPLFFIPLRDMLLQTLGFSERKRFFTRLWGSAIVLIIIYGITLISEFRLVTIARGATTGALLGMFFPGVYYVKSRGYFRKLLPYDHDFGFSDGQSVGSKDVKLQAGEAHFRIMRFLQGSFFMMMGVFFFFSGLGYAIYDHIAIPQWWTPGF